MEYQTWTRKANAEAAVKKLLADAPMDYFIYSVEAGNVAPMTNAPAQWAVKVEVDNTPSEADALQEILGNKARVQALRPEPVPAEAQPEPKPKRATKAELEHLFTKKPHATKAGQRRLTCHGANPFKRGASYDAWEWLAARPGTTYAECKAAGIRMRAISEAIRMGWVTVE